MQTTPHPLPSEVIAHCAETNEKSIFQFLFSELWSIVFKIYKCGALNLSSVSPKNIMYSPKRCAMFWNEFFWFNFFCAILNLWDMIDFVFNVRFSVYIFCRIIYTKQNLYCNIYVDIYIYMYIYCKITYTNQNAYDVVSVSASCNRLHR